MNVLCTSHGKDSLACIGACELLGIPIDRIVHAEVWATDTIPADLPPMVEFKKHADKIIKERWGIEVEHICALKTQGWVVANKLTNQCFITNCKAENMQEQLKAFHKQSEVGARSSKWKQAVLTYEDMFYQQCVKTPKIYGFPHNRVEWCKILKRQACSQIVQVEREPSSQIVQILGIAADEPKRIEKHINRKDIRLPLVEAGWTEAMCREWCEENDLLSPIYTTATRGGCWFCHNQGVDQLRLLRKNYPELWALLLKWDNDSPVTFKPDGHTVHDFDRRFQAEDNGLIIPGDRKFRWSQIDGEVQIKFF